MASIYIHFPFCKSRCIYCDFFSTTFLDLRSSYVEALKKELEMQRGFLGGEPVKSIYLGGGTPSQMDVGMLSEVFRCVYDLFDVVSAAEVTMECNPDDLNDRYLSSMRELLPVNRVSIGVQSFDDARLSFLHRRHTASGAIEALSRCREHGYANLSVDLIYGFPGQSLEEWEADIDQAVGLDVEHLSAYALMYEEGTALYGMLSSGLVEELDEEVSVSMYDLLLKKMASSGYRHYEISNFCKPGFHSRHNSGYWDGTHYLGIGAGAHSYNGSAREWNEPYLDLYISGIMNGKVGYRGREELDDRTRFNEQIMTSLRTSAGVNLTKLEHQFGIGLKDALLAKAARYIQGGQLEAGLYIPIDTLTPTSDKALRLTAKAVFTSNGIISDLFV